MLLNKILSKTISLSVICISNISFAEEYYDIYHPLSGYYPICKEGQPAIGCIGEEVDIGGNVNVLGVSGGVGTYCDKSSNVINATGAIISGRNDCN